MASAKIRSKLVSPGRTSEAKRPDPPAAAARESEADPQMPVSLDSVIITEQLTQRPWRRPQYGAENRALCSLAQAIVGSAEDIYERIAQIALELCRAHSAGFSLLDESGARFYWPAIAGKWAPHVGGGAPAAFSPGGIVLDRNAAQLFQRPERHFPYLAPVKPRVEEALLVPFYANGRTVGALWVMAHDRIRRFDSEDLRVMTSLATFASAAYQTTHAVREGELSGARHLQSISRELIHAGKADALYEKILETAIALMRSDMGSMQMLYPERNELRLLAYNGFHPDAAKFWEWVQPDSGSTCGVALQTRQRVIVSDVETCDFMAGTDDLHFYRQSKIRAVQSTPLISRSGALLGMISTHWSRPYAPSEHDLRMFDILARQAADLIERLRAEEALKRSNELLEERVRTRTRELERQIHETKRAEDGLRAVNARLFKVQDDERRFVARELHAGAGQTLAVLSINLGRLTRLAVGEEAHGVVQECQSLINTFTKEIRTVSYVLHPPLLEELGLVFALRMYAHGFSESSGIPVGVDVEEEALPNQLPKDTEIALFRIVQESLANIHRHSGATAAKIRVAACDGSLRVTIADNGVGIPEEKQFVSAASAESGVGILGMRERIRRLGGSFAIGPAADAFAEKGSASGAAKPANRYRAASENDAHTEQDGNGCRPLAQPANPGTCVTVTLPLPRAVTA